MKKTIASILLVVLLLTSTYRPTYALFGIGDIVFDPSALGQNIKNAVVQGYQLAKETITAASTNITAIQQTLETVNNTVLIPAASIMAVTMILAQKNAVINLVLGSTGVDPMLVRDPETYVKNKGLEVVNSSLGDIASLKANPYSNSILASVVANTRSDSASLSTKIASINQDSNLANEQKKRCADTALSAQAQKDVAKADGTYDQSAYTARKAEISKAICGSLNDPATVTALNAVVAKQPSWDSWLALTGGNNAYTKSIATQQAIADEAAKKIATAKADLASGGGLRSATTCLVRAKTNANGEPYAANDKSAPCITEQIKQTANVISDSFKKAISAPVDILKQAIAPGSGIVSLINTALTTYSLVSSIAAAADSLGGGSSGGGGGGSNTVTITASTTINRDLIGNPEAKDAVASGPVQQLNYEKSGLAKLADTDTKFLTTISSYRNSIEEVRSCYAQLATDFEEGSSSTQYGAVQRLYTTKLAAISTKQTEITTEQGQLQRGLTLINETLAKIEDSQSTQEILNLFLGYQTTVKSQKLPDSTAQINREGNYVEYSSDYQITTNQGGEIFELKADCATLRQQYEAARRQGGGGA